MTDRTTTICTRVTFETADRLDDLSEQTGFSRSEVIRYLLARAAQEPLPPELVKAAETLRPTRLSAAR